MDMPCGSTLEWGYAGAFRAVRSHPQPRIPNPGKWISFLPSSMPLDRRTQVFDALALEVLSHPHLGSLVHGAKMALRPLFQHPHRIAFMLYCDESSQQAVLEHLAPLARAHRRALLTSGELATRDGFMGRWEYKTDAQTKKEMEAGTHDAQVSRMMLLLGMEPPPTRSPRP